MHPGPTDSIGRLVENLFRRESARIVAGLTRRLGASRLMLAEDAAQEALGRALEHWPFSGVPGRPEAWLWTVAQRFVLDALRRDRAASAVPLEAHTEDRVDDAVADSVSGAAAEQSDDSDVLRLMGLCCHPLLPEESRIALVLKNVCGFGIDEVASALLARPNAVKRRLARARAVLREKSVPWTEEDPGAMEERADSVLLSLYLLFNEGYYTASTDEPMRLELMGEALRCVRLLARAPGASPSADAAAALFCLLAARCRARSDEDGTPCSLAEQHRALWDTALTAEGFRFFERSLRGGKETRFHLEAAIAASHAAAPTWASTPWPQILTLYNRLLSQHPSMIAGLGRCVALAKVEGPERALAALDQVSVDPSDPLCYATRAQLLWLAGRHDAAATELRQAIELESSRPRQRFLQKRLEACLSGARPLDW